MGHFPLEVNGVAQRVDLDAMIGREDFGIIGDGNAAAINRISELQISQLERDAPISRLLRKPDFQRETNHWSPEQVVMFIESFVDYEVIPSVIFWKSDHYIFVIDGGHRLSALRAWMEDDYGDKHISRKFYKKEISAWQSRIAEKTRKLIEKRVGRYTDLKAQVDSKEAPELIRRRAQNLFTRGIPLLWIVKPNAEAAETSFFKINSQGTPLDDTESLLIKNRKKPIAIGARAILRAGSGHKYWSGFDAPKVGEIERIASEFHENIFKPELEEPAKTLELPIGGSASPIDALALLIEFLEIAGTREKDGGKSIDSYANDISGDDTIQVLQNAYYLLNRISSNNPGSLGLHPAVYFYNEKGKYTRFLFLGMVSVIQSKLRNNDSEWFRKFTRVRFKTEQFLTTNKSIIGAVLQNLSKRQRVPKIAELIEFLVYEFQNTDTITIETAMAKLNLIGRFIDVRSPQTGPRISDDTKSAVFLKQAMASAIECAICGGLLDPKKSSTYDHIVRREDGGTGDLTNVQLVHPYCNDGYKESGAVKGKAL